MAQPLERKDPFFLMLAEKSSEKIVRKGSILEAKPLRQIFETTRKDLFHISQFKVSVNYEYPEDVKLTRSPCQYQFTPTSISQGPNPNWYLFLTSLL